MWVQLAILRSTIFARSGTSRFTCERLVGALLALLAVFFALSARSDQPVAVRTGIHDGFGRLVLELPAPVAVTGRPEGSRYRLRFEQPLEVVLDAAVDRLGAFLAGARLGGDDRELTLDLKPGVAVRQHVFERRIVVLDLSPADPVAPSEQVEVRTGLHQGFARIVFHWPVPITFDALTTDRRVTIRFGRSGHIDAGKSAARLGAWVANASATRGAGRSDVRLDLQPGVTGRAFKVDDNRVAIDLFRVPARSSESGAAGEAQSPAPPRSSIVPSIAASPDLAPSAPEHDGFAEVRTASGAQGDGANDDGAKDDRAKHDGAENVGVGHDGAENDGVKHGGAFLNFASARPVGAAVFVRASYLWVVFAGETDPPEDFAVPPALRDDLGPGERIEASGGKAIRFALRRPLSAEARREDAIWRVRLRADAQAPQPLYPLRLASPRRLRLEPGEPPRLVVLRDPESGEQLTAWPLLQTNLGQPRQNFVELELLPTAQGLAWRLRSDRVRARIVGEAVEFDAPGGLALSESPESGPSAPAEAVEPPAPTADTAPSTPALAPPARAIASGPGRQPSAPSAATTPGSEPSAPTGATAPGNEPSAPSAATAPGRPLSAPAVATEPRGDIAAPAPVARARPPAARAQPAPEPPRIDHLDSRSAGEPSPLGLVGWGLDPAYTAPERRSQLLQALAHAAPDERNARRIELARYHLSRDLGAEALGVLGSVEEPEDDATRAARQGLTGAAELLMGRIDAAAAALGAAYFDHPEVALWRCAIAARRQDWPQAALELERSEQVLGTYPPALRLRLGLAAASSALETGDAALAATLLAQLEALELAPAQRARLGFLSGVASARSGAVQAADEIWRTLEHDGPVEVRIQAAYARTELLLQAGELEPAEAVARLAATRGLWAGHSWEERMLRGLAQIYADAGDRASALRTWRELLDRFPDTADGPAVTVRMREALIETLRGEGAAELGPVQAYALFREFEPLLPDDGSADGLRRRMAERLADLDLIRPAAALLEVLIAGRPAGIERAAAGADLAELWLREPAPEAALSALERSRVEAALPAALAERRRVLEADARARLGHRAAALALLDGVASPAADDLRVAILRQEQDWSRLISAVEHALERRDQGSPLSEGEQAMVLELALAHRRLGQSAPLAQLRTRFAAALRGLAIEPAFLMATSSLDAASAPEAVLAVAEQHLRQVRTYLEQHSMRQDRQVRSSSR